MKLVVIIPALNEEATLADVIGRIPRRIDRVDEIAVIVVDDGSTDATADRSRQAGATVVSHRRNRGVGAAFRTGIGTALDAGADLIVNMDADAQFSPEDIPALVAPILDGLADMTTCSRFARKEYVPRMPAVKRWGNRLMCWLVNRVCWGARFTDVSCGFRAYSRQTALQLTLFGDFTYTQESFIDLVAKGVEIVEVPLKVRGVREIGTSRVAGNLWHYAANAATIILRAARDIRPLAFFGGIGLIFMVLGVLCCLIVFGWWLATHQTSPIKNVLIGGGVFLILGFVLLVLALIADMLGRQRRILERFILAQRLHPNGTPPASNGTPPPANGAAGPPPRPNAPSEASDARPD